LYIISKETEKTTSVQGDAELFFEGALGAMNISVDFMPGD